jgi:hypothetical protein
MATFDFGGLLGSNMFGGGDMGLDEYLTPEQRARMNQQGIMALAASLLKSSGPSAVPVGIGQALGEAYGAGQTGYQQAQTGAIANINTRQKLDEYRRNQELQKNVEEFLGQAAPEGMSPTEFKSQQYYKLADKYAARSPEQSSKFFEMAQKLNPRSEVTGQPFQLSTKEGKPVLVQQFKDGTIRTMEGFGPQREVVLQNVDGVMMAIDKSALVGGEKFGTGITPAERIRLGIEQQRLGLSQAEFARGGYDRVTNEQGIFYVPKTPGMPTIPITGPDGAALKGTAPPKPTEAEQNAAGFSQRMERTEQILNTLSGSQPGYGSALTGAIPFVGGATQRLVQAPNVQMYKQAADDWIRAKLRKESGAAIGKDEMESEYRTYFPQTGDSPGVIAQKSEARRVATEAMRLNAGAQYRPYVPQQPSANAPSAGTLTWDPVQKKFVTQ